MRDNGVGITRENLAKVFNHGFTTKKKGHGFGLHNCANAAQQMDGSLTAYSDGPGHGRELRAADAGGVRGRAAATRRLRRGGRRGMSEVRKL